MPGAPTGNENYIKLLLFHTHQLTVSCGTFEYFMSFTHIGYKPIKGWCRTYADKLIFCKINLQFHICVNPWVTA